MSWIETVPDDEWSAKGDLLADLHKKVVDPTHGRVDNIMAVHSLNPRGLAAHQNLYSSAMAGTASLRKVEREMIALVVSLENECHY
ncbi:MAG: peroxidase [Acidimicrobiia bacterium]|nr:peroxidase [Actinomycetota bacterium]MBL6925085.1 peroxidase [Acidimicrobiia bacterium]MBL6927083.1 peroxidase [Acidimicrobiia bacterium]